MGNSAMKCCRCRGRRTVIVVLLSGEVAEFKEPVRASTVMKRYPEHVVLHCRMASNRGMGQRRKTSVMKPDQPLERNQNYLLTPSKTAENAKSFLDSWAFLALSVNKKKSKATVRHKATRNNPNRRSWIQALFDKFFLFRRYSLGNEHETDPLLGRNRSQFEPQKSSGSLQCWRPSLERIPESPSLSRDSSVSSYHRLDFG
ncbi:unnamed protein product [Calypogeia fissa]